LQPLGAVPYSDTLCVLLVGAGVALLMLIFMACVVLLYGLNLAAGVVAVLMAAAFLTSPPPDLIDGQRPGALPSRRDLASFGSRLTFAGVAPIDRLAIGQCPVDCRACECHGAAGACCRSRPGAAHSCTPRRFDTTPTRRRRGAGARGGRVGGGPRCRVAFLVC